MYTTTRSLCRTGCQNVHRGSSGLVGVEPLSVPCRDMRAGTGGATGSSVQDWTREATGEVSDGKEVLPCYIVCSVEGLAR